MSPTDLQQLDDIFNEIEHIAERVDNIIAFLRKDHYELYMRCGLNLPRARQSLYKTADCFYQFINQKAHETNITPF